MAEKVIRVTQENIDRAIQNCSSRCVVADALREAVPNAVRVRVDIQTIRWSDPQKQLRYIYLTPARIQQYIIAFDAGDPIEPFQFRLSHQGRQVIPMHKMPADVQEKLNKVRIQAKGDGTVQKMGGKPPPTMGPTTTRGYGICGLRLNKDRKVTVNRDADVEV
jgi:hypothetical protein